MSEIVPMSGTFVAPVIDVENALRAYQAMKDFVGKVLRDDVDFGVIPGTNKPTLLKPGAEKLCRFFGLSTHLNPLETIMDWTGEKHNGEPFFYFQYKVVALRNGVAVAEGVGSCSNWEKKYRYRNADLICPSCGKPNIRKSKQGDGWYCWTKTGGCGATFRGNDKQITDQPHGQIINPDPADLVNTIDKMAQKRAFIAAVLIACNASEYFTQDIEDYYVEGEFEDKPKKTEPKPETTPEAVKIDGKPIDISHSSTTQNVIQPELDGSNGKMALETALAVQNSEGITYGELDDETLGHMANTMRDVLAGKKKTSKYTPEDLKFKVDAIDVILAHRSAG